MAMDPNWDKPIPPHDQLKVGSIELFPDIPSWEKLNTNLKNVRALANAALKVIGDSKYHNEQFHSVAELLGILQSHNDKALEIVEGLIPNKHTK